MPEVYAESILDVRLGTQMVGALMAGDNKIYVRLEKHTYETPGNFSFILPDWASAYGVVASGAGGGGRAGSGANNSVGPGGRGGEIQIVEARLDSSSDRVLRGFIGAGGVGGSSSDAYGQKGGNTSLTTHSSKNFIAEGGTANPSSGKQAGGTVSITVPDPWAKYINIAPGSQYRNGPGGTGNGGAGKRGGGGAGGNGGYFNRYTRGGKGGDGYVEIYVWGLDPNWTPPTPPTTPTPEKVQITLGLGTEARDQFRSALTERGLDYQTITEVPFEIELVGTGSTANMFYGCSKLVSGPDMDTSQVTRMTYMFYDCQSLTSFPDMDTSQVTNMAYMFWNCRSLTSVPDMDTSKVLNMSYMFQTCSSLTDGNVRLIGRHPQLNSMSMTANSGLTREPFYDAAGNPI